MGATSQNKTEATHNDQPNNKILCEASIGIEAIDAVPTVRRRSDTERQRASVLPLHTRRIMGGDSMTDEQCAICELGDDSAYGDSYICSCCEKELEVMAAEQYASRWD